MWREGSHAIAIAAEGSVSDDGCVGLGTARTRQLNGRAAAARARKIDPEGAADARNSRETVEVTLSSAMMTLPILQFTTNLTSMMNLVFMCCLLTT